jgi:hypothetical protein
MTVAPEIGGTYRLRCGEIVTISLKVCYNGTDKVAFYIGEYIPQGERRYSCQRDGYYAPEAGVRPHQLDIVEKIPA